MYTLHFNHHLNTNQKAFLQQALINTQNGLVTKQHITQSGELLMHINKARDENNAFIDGKMQDTENQMHMGWGSTQLPLTVRMNRIRQGLSRVPRGNLHARMFKHSGIYSTNRNHIYEQGFGRNVGDIIAALAMSQHQIQLEKRKCQEQKQKITTIRQQLKDKVGFKLRDKEFIHNILDSTLLSEFDKTMNFVRAAGADGKLNVKENGLLLTNEEYRTMLTYLLDPANKQTVLRNIKDLEDLQQKITNLEQDGGNSMLPTERLKKISDLQGEYAEKLSTVTKFDVGPLQMGLKEMDSMITIQIDSLKKFRDADVHTQIDNQRLIDKNNSVSTSSLFTGRHEKIMDSSLTANNQINQGLTIYESDEQNVNNTQDDIVKDDSQEENQEQNNEQIKEENSQQQLDIIQTKTNNNTQEFAQ